MYVPHFGYSKLLLIQLDCIEAFNFNNYEVLNNINS